MTDKRFKYGSNKGWECVLIDTLYEKEYDFCEVAKLCNKLWKQTQQLEKHNEYLKKEIIQLKKYREELFFRERDTKNDWEELKQENESLKEEIKFLRNKVATYKKGNALLKSTMDNEWK